MALGAEVIVPVREFDVRCGTHAFRGVIVDVQLSNRCARAFSELEEVLFLCACAPYWRPFRGRYAF